MVSFSFFCSFDDNSVLFRYCLVQRPLCTFLLVSLTRGFLLFLLTPILWLGIFFQLVHLARKVAPFSAVNTCCFSTVMLISSTVWYEKNCAKSDQGVNLSNLVLHYHSRGRSRRKFQLNLRVKILYYIHIYLQIVC